jgi:hypothetical protein
MLWLSQELAQRHGRRQRPLRALLACWRRAPSLQELWIRPETTALQLAL